MRLVKRPGIILTVPAKMTMPGTQSIELSEYLLSYNNEVKLNLTQTSDCVSTKNEAYFTITNDSVRCQIRHPGTRIMYSRDYLWKLKVNKTHLSNEAKHNISELGIKKHFRGRRAGKHMRKKDQRALSSP